MHQAVRPAHESFAEGEGVGVPGGDIAEILSGEEILCVQRRELGELALFVF